MRRLSWLFPSLAVLGMSACSDKPPEPSPEDIQVARRAASELDMEIKRRFIARIEAQENPVAVYLAYRSNVAEITREIGEKYGVELSRTGFRVRNRAHVADDWEYEKLEALEFSIEAGLEPATLSFSEVIENEDGSSEFRWIKPMVMQFECLACHGENIAPELLDLLNTEYPQDESTGFFEYEFGGAYSVRKMLD